MKESNALAMSGDSLQVTMPTLFGRRSTLNPLLWNTAKLGFYRGN
jgi:hypothetical protein